MSYGTDLTGGFGAEQGAGITPFLMFNLGGAADVGRFERHGQVSLTKGQALVIELKEKMAAVGKGDGGKTTGIVKILVDVKCVVGGIKGAVGRFEAEPSFGGCHQREEVGGIALVEGLGQFSQGKLAPAGLPKYYIVGGSVAGPDDCSYYVVNTCTEPYSYIVGFVNNPLLRFGT